MSILGAGIDLVDVQRLARMMDAHPSFVKLVFADPELSIQRTSGGTKRIAAAAFAAKEAFLKALSLDLGHGPPLTQVRVRWRSGGRPLLVLEGLALRALRERGGAAVYLAIAMTRTTAAATVIIEAAISQR